INLKLRYTLFPYTTLFRSYKMNNNILKTKYKFKAMFSKILREHIQICGICSNCKKPNTERAWCNKCDPGRFLKERKTSGNREIRSEEHTSELQSRGHLVCR